MDFDCVFAELILLGIVFLKLDFDGVSWLLNWKKLELFILKFSSLSPTGTGSELFFFLFVIAVVFVFYEDISLVDL